MQRINTTNKATDLFGAGKNGYRAGNPATGQSATELSYAAMNALQEEIAYVIEASGAALSAADNTQLYTRIVAMISAATPPAAYGYKPGNIFIHTGATAPTGAMVVPVAATNVSRTTYAALFAAIGTTWGAGDGVTTFGLPWFPEGYALLQANANVGTQTVGQVIAHSHAQGLVLSAGGIPGTGGAYAISNTGTTGGAANLAAGVKVLLCVQYL